MARLQGRAAAATGREQLDLVEALRADLYEHDFTEEELRAGLGALWRGGHGRGGSRSGDSAPGLVAVRGRRGAAEGTLELRDARWRTTGSRRSGGRSSGS